MNRQISNNWFFSKAHPLLYLLLIFVKGDMLSLLPLVIVIGLSYLLSIKIGLLLTGTYIAIRYFGEMVYWIMQQFGERKYRPNDFGFKNLDNHAIYILYQTSATCGALLGVALIYFSLLTL